MMRLFLKEFQSIQCNRRIFNSLRNLLNNSSSQIRRSQSFSSGDFLPNTSHKLNCDIYILSQDGSLGVDHGPFDRANICQKYNLEPRDLQKIDTDLLINVPLIDVRQNKFICFSFRRLRSLIQFDRSIIFVPSVEKIMSEPVGTNNAIRWEHIAQTYHRNIRYIQQLYSERFVNQTSLNDNDQTIPFEFRMTEINLETIAQGLRTKINELSTDFRSVRERAYHQITIGSLRELVLLKEKVDKYKRNAELAHQAIIDILAQDEDMIGMYLTDNRKREISDHIQIELLLEASTKQMAEVRRTVSDLSDSIRTIESATGFMLDAVRNDLLAFEIKINILTMGLGTGALIAGLYGMNLNHGLEQSPYGFYIVTGATLTFISAIIIGTFMRMLRFRKVRLHRINKIQ